MRQRLDVLRFLIPVFVLALVQGCATSATPRTTTAIHVRAGAPRDWDVLLRALESAHPELEARHTALSAIRPSERSRLFLITEGTGPVGVRRQSTRVARVLEPGDLIFLHANQRLATESPIRALELRMITPLPSGLPTFVGYAEHIRSDDEKPNRDAKHEGWESRRVDVLAWLPGEAPAYQGVNVKLVQVEDAPTHYHPEVGGFDEIVFVREAEPGSGVLFSTQREAIESHNIDRADVGRLLHPLALASGDVLFVPRGLVHRPRGRSSAVVIALPGFVPGGEVRLDEDLRKINAALELEGDAALPSFSAPEQPSL